LGQQETDLPRSDLGRWKRHPNHYNANRPRHRPVSRRERYGAASRKVFAKRVAQSTLKPCMAVEVVTGTYRKLQGVWKTTPETCGKQVENFFRWLICVLRVIHWCFENTSAPWTHRHAASIGPQKPASKCPVASAAGRLRSSPAYRTCSQGTSPITALERSRWRDGRFACYAPYVMLQGRAFNCDFRFSLIFLSQAQSIGCKRKKIQFP